MKAIHPLHTEKNETNHLKETRTNTHINNAMTTDLANVIVNLATRTCMERRLTIELSLCKDNDDVYDASIPLDETKSYVYFRNVPFETDGHLGCFRFTLDRNKNIIYEGFSFDNFEVSMNLLLKQYVLHAQYLQDMSLYDVILMNIRDGDKQVAFCFNLASVEVPSSEAEGIVNEIFDNIHEPINMVFKAWKSTIDTI